MSKQTAEEDVSQLLVVGIDVHKDNQAVVAANGFNQVLLEKEISSKYSEYQELAKEIRLIANEKDLRPVIALEDAYGYGEALSRFFFSAGFEVRTVNPVLTRRERGYMTHPEKSDLQDAKGVVKATILEGIGRLPSFRVTPEGEFCQDLRPLVYDREFLVKEQTRLKNQLHRLLHASYCGYYKRLFKNPFTNKALKLWQDFPSLAELKKTKRRITKPNWVKKISKQSLSQVSPFQLKQIKRKTKRLIQISQEAKEIDEDIEKLLKRSGHCLESIRGCGQTVAAGILAEVRDISRFPSSDAFAKYNGTAPRAWGSGKTKRDKATLAGNRQLNKWIQRIALSQIGNRGYPKGKAYYRKKLSEGKSKKQALRYLKRQISDVIYLILKERRPFYE